MSKVKRYDPPVSRWKGNKGWLFYFFLIPLFLSVIFSLFGLNVSAFILNTLAFVMMYTTMLVAKKGFAQEEVYENAKLTKAPKKPYKQIAAIMLAATVFFTAYVAGEKEIFISLFLALLSFTGFWLYYGFDPKKDKLKDFGDISSELVLKTLHETEEKINHLKKDADKIEDRQLSDKVHLAIKKSNNILDALVEDPKDIRVARKFLVVYLDGISDVISSYNEVEEAHISSQTKEKLLTLMDDVEKRFQKELNRLKANNLFDLDVNIDTLKEQIKH